MNIATIHYQPAGAGSHSPGPQLKGKGHRFHTMVKPSGAQCNLDCTYCFYLHKEDLLAQPKQSRMSATLLEMHIRQYIEAQAGADEIVFSWQGGEPTLMKLDFFERVVALQRQYKQPGQSIENDFQTNGILLDDDWCQFLKANNFLVGLSIDGPAQLHDAYRVNLNGGGTFAKVFQAAMLLHQYQIPFSALCVVNRLNAREPLRVYEFLRDEIKPRLIQFIPGVEVKSFHNVAPGEWNVDDLPAWGSPQSRPGHENSFVTDWSVNPEDWGHFLSTIWDEWFERDFGDVFVDQFENVIAMLLGQSAQKCVNREICGKGLALEHNGDLYSCDHFVYPRYKLGNIQQTHEGDLASSKQQEAFAYAKRDTLPNYCKQCSFLKLCWGECPKSRFLKTPDGEAGLNYLCAGLKIFYAKASSYQSELQNRLLD